MSSALALYILIFHVMTILWLVSKYGYSKDRQNSVGNRQILPSICLFAHLLPQYTDSIPQRAVGKEGSKNCTKAQKKFGEEFTIRIFTKFAGAILQ